MHPVYWRVYQVSFLLHRGKATWVSVLPYPWQFVVGTAVQQPVGSTLDEDTKKREGVVLFHF